MKNFKKENLRTGHLVITENSKFIVFKDTAIKHRKADVAVYVRDSEHNGWDELQNALLDESKIKKVYATNNPIDMISYKNTSFEINNWSLVWECKEEKTIVELDGVEYSESTLRSLIKKATN